MCGETSAGAISEFMDDLKNGGVQILHNETACFWIDGEKVAVTGYELPWEYYRRFSRRHPSVVGMERSIGKRKQDAYQILLTHNPVFLKNILPGVRTLLLPDICTAVLSVCRILAESSARSSSYSRSTTTVCIRWIQAAWSSVPAWVIIPVCFGSTIRPRSLPYGSRGEIMGIAVKLQAFEGPLDLLLHLIEKNKVSIYDIPIAEITDQYMAYLHEMKKQDLGVMSEFLLMAATLLDIKSRMLLPKEVNEEGEEEDPRQELVQQLLEYKMYKYISYELKERRQDAAQVLYHKQDLPEEVKAYKQPVSTEELLAGVTLSRMHRIFVDIIRRQNNRIDPIRSTFGTLQKEEVDMDQMREKVAEYIEQHEVCNFRELLLGQATKMQVIIAFLIILEMMKEGVITIVQEESFGEIHIAKNKTDESGS